MTENYRDDPVPLCSLIAPLIVSTSKALQIFGSFGYLNQYDLL